MSRHNTQWSLVVPDKDRFEIDTLFMKEVTSPHCQPPSLFFLLGEPSLATRPDPPRPQCSPSLLPAPSSATPPIPDGEDLTNNEKAVFWKLSEDSIINATCGMSHEK
ncbi:hypothetical protein E2C01_001472 [Portunus trituberculatus]|uniref:Uncharacterized protein n=1 Tax=Portunus trituberculatus TaxID=210409 RepID=A0A5B7CH93_PORTR|nr:hypothetical protein [Portunus trituberculatus]